MVERWEATGNCPLDDNGETKLNLRIKGSRTEIVETIYCVIDQGGEAMRGPVTTME